MSVDSKLYGGVTDEMILASYADMAEDSKLIAIFRMKQEILGAFDAIEILLKRLEMNEVALTAVVEIGGYAEKAAALVTKDKPDTPTDANWFRAGGTGGYL